MKFPAKIVTRVI